MSTIGQSNWTVSFGKHKGEPLRDVPTDYLVWCKTKIEENPTKGPLSNTVIQKHILSELRWRDGKPPIEENPGISAVTTLTQNEAGVVEVKDKPLKARRVSLEEVAVNRFSTDIECLKAFVRRSDQEVGILDWMKALTSETLRYGKKVRGMSPMAVYQFGPWEITLEVADPDDLYVESITYAREVGDNSQGEGNISSPAEASNGEAQGQDN